MVWELWFSNKLVKMISLIGEGISLSKDMTYQPVRGRNNYELDSGDMVDTGRRSRMSWEAWKTRAYRKVSVIAPGMRNKCRSCSEQWYMLVKARLLFPLIKRSFGGWDLQIWNVHKSKLMDRQRKIAWPVHKSLWQGCLRPKGQGELEYRSWSNRETAWCCSAVSRLCKRFFGLVLK